MVQIVAMMYNNWTLLQVLLALVCLTKLSCGFNAATTLPSSVHVAPSSVLTSKSATPHNRWGEESFKKCTLQLKAHSTTHHHHHDVGNPYHISSSGSSLRSSGLFPARQQQHAMHTTSRLQMTTTPDNNNNDISSSSDNNTNNPLVRIWLKLRVFMARLWVSR